MLICWVARESASGKNQHEMPNLQLDFCITQPGFNTRVPVKPSLDAFKPNFYIETGHYTMTINYVLESF